jgi:hypothetical protein
VANDRLIYRCLGVPDMLTEDSKPQAAARRLAEAAGLDVTLDPNMSHQSQLRLADAANVIARASGLVAAGELDGFIGNFRYRDDDWYASLITRRIDLHVYEQGQRCAQALLESLRNYITSHPFEDDSGRPFA